MYKKILVLLAGVGFSMSAFAGYVQYDFSGPLSGSFVQHDDDQSIADYQFNMPVAGTPYPFSFMFRPLQGDGVDRITSETTHFSGSGPTSFDIYDDYGGDRSMSFIIDFAPAAGNTFSYKVTYVTSIYFATTDGATFLPFSGTLTGFVSVGTVSDGLARTLDDNCGYYEGVPDITPRYIGPANVPEPGSLALLAAGALGAAGVARRRKASA